MMRRPHRIRRGLLIQECLIGLVILAMLGGMLAVTSSRHDQAMRHMAAKRNTLREVEAAALELKSGSKPPAGVTVRPLETKSPAPGMQWVEISKAADSKTSLVTLVPTGDKP